MSVIQLPPTIRRLKAKFRLRLKAGFHVDTDNENRDTMYNQGDVFLSRKPLHRKWPEKFEQVDDFVPLSGGQMKIAEAGTEIDAREEDEEYEVVPNPALSKTRYPIASSPTSSPENPSVAQAPGQPQQSYPQQPQSQAQRPPRIEDEATLAQMTVNELKAYAEDEEIDLKGASKKEDILRIIKQNRGK